MGFPSIAFATPSDPGLFAEEAITGSPGCATLWAYATELAAKKLLTNTVCIRRFMLSLCQKSVFWDLAGEMSALGLRHCQGFQKGKMYSWSSSEAFLP